MVALPSLSLRGIAGAIPPGVVDLVTLKSVFGADDVERIMAVTGIRQVRVAPSGLCTSDLCEAAAKHLLERLEVPATSVDGIVFVSQTPDYRMPATSMLLQHRLGLPKTSVAVDFNCGCSGFVYGLFQSALLVSSGACRRVLLMAGDVMTPYLNEGDKANRMVFGDGGSAAIIEVGSSTWHFETWTDGSGAASLVIPAGGGRLPASDDTKRAQRCTDGYFRTLEQLHMQGTKVFNFAVREVPAIVAKLVSTLGWSLPSIELLGLHQANHYMVRAIRRILELPESVVPADSGKIGNTGPASIPLLLSLRGAELSRIRPLERSILCGFGAGYSIAAVGLSLTETQFVPPVVAEATRKPLVNEARGYDV